MQKGQFRELSVSDEEDSHISVILLDSHSGFYFPPSSMVPLSLQRGKRVAFFTFVAIGILVALWFVEALKLYRVTLSRAEYFFI